MIGGNPVGSIIGGSSFVWDSVVINIPVDAVSLSDYAPTVSGGASLFLPADTVTLQDYIFDVEIFLRIDLPVDGVSLTDYPPTVSGGASINMPVDIVTLEDFPFEDITIIMNGVPDFYAFKTGTTVELTFRDRDGREIEIFKAPQQNRSFAQLVFVDADSYEDTGVSGNPKYKARYVSRISGEINAAGKKSTEKYTVTNG